MNDSELDPLIPIREAQSRRRAFEALAPFDQNVYLKYRP
jgi:hypothetical protein